MAKMAAGTAQVAQVITAVAPSQTCKESMQILLHSDPSTDGSHLMAQHLSVVVNAAMGRFGERITRVEAHLSDVNGSAKSSGDDIHCTLEARVVGLDAIVVKHHAGNAHQAIDGALRKLKRAVETELTKHDARGHRLRPETLADEGGSEDAADGVNRP